MPRHALTLDELIRGCEKALANPKTLKQFLASTRARLEQLRKQKEQHAKS
jgi:exonuclease VII small subunit